MKIKLTKKPRTVRRIAREAGCCRVTVYRWLKTLPPEVYAVDYVRERETGPYAKAYYCTPGLDLLESL